MLKYLGILLTGFIWSFNVHAQTVYKNYKDGRIYLQFTQVYYDQHPEVFADDQMAEVISGAPFVIRSSTRPFANEANSDALKRITRITLANPVQIDEALRFLRGIPVIEFAEKSPLVEMIFTPNDPYYSNGKLWYLDKINAPEAWDITKGSRDVVVAVVDNAIQMEHPDLVANLWTNPGEIPNNNIDDDGNGAIDDVRGWDVSDKDDYTSPPTLVPNWSHGTQTSGLVSATTNNGQGIAAIGFNLSICPVKVESDQSNNPTKATDAYEGLNYALNTPAVDIISMSWGFTGLTQTQDLLIKEAASRGKILVAGAGNNNANIGFYPAAHQNVIAIAGTDSLDKKSSFSNYASWVDISAPASDIISSVLTVLDPPYFVSGGTSFATPMTAGTIGLMLTVNPNLTQEEVLNCLKSTADNISAKNPTYSGKLGAGRLNAWKAVECAQALVGINPDRSVDVPEIKIYPNPSSGRINIQLNYSATSIQIYNSIGTLVASESSQNNNMNIDLSSLATGLYRCVTYDKSGVRRNKSFMLE